MTGKRIAIVGAGPSGLAQLRAFQADPGAGGPDAPEVVCFEKQDDWGGLWNYTWRTGLDEYGEPVHGSMYRYLWSNGPEGGARVRRLLVRGALRPPDRLLPAARGAQGLHRRARREGGRAGTASTSARPCARCAGTRPTDDLLGARARPASPTRSAPRRFDHVVVASGHFSTPNVPAFDGLDGFAGRVLHAHDFREAREFAERDILIVGTSYSAEDIGSQCWKYGARSITVSHRTAPMGYALAGQLARSAAARRRSRDVPLHVHRRHHVRGRRDHPLHRLPCTTSRSWRPSSASRRRTVWPRPISGRASCFVPRPGAVLPRHAGPVVHLQHVRRAGLVRARRDARAHRGARRGSAARRRRGAKSPPRTRSRTTTARSATRATTCAS